MENTNQFAPINGLHHISFRSSDFEATIRFFKEGLGFKELMTWNRSSGSPGMILDCGNGNRVEVFGGGSESDPLDDQHLFHLALLTEDVAQSHARALEFGATERMAPKAIEVDAQQGKFPLVISFVKAPGGAVIEFFQSGGV